MLVYRDTMSQLMSHRILPSTQREQTTTLDTTINEDEDSQTEGSVVEEDEETSLQEVVDFISNFHLVDLVQDPLQPPLFHLKTGPLVRFVVATVTQLCDVGTCSTTVIMKKNSRLP